MKLIILESPNKISKVSEYVGKDYVVIASCGHINRIRDSGAYNLGIDLDRKFKINYELISSKIQILQNILDQVEKADVVYLCMDPDREGSGISNAIFERIKGFNKPIKRASFNKITKEAIEEALDNAGDLDYKLIRSQEARCAIDKIVGYMCSPYLMTKLQQKSISAGRVQSVAVKFVVERENEIENFKPEDYFVFQIPLAYNNINFTTKYDGKIKTQKAADDFMNYLTDKNTTFVVSKVTSKAEKYNPPAPFTTSTLTQAMARKHKWSADTTMEVAQKLFADGTISYHRTDSPSISKESLDSLLHYIKSKNLPLPSKPFVYESKQINSQEAHECIHPTDINAVKVFGGDNNNLLYATIRQQFIISQLAPAVYNTLRVQIDAINGKTKEKLICSGKALKTPGFLSYLNVDDKSQINIPDLQKGYICNLLSKPICDKKHTNPPSRYSVSEMLKTLEKSEIGRPSTTPQILKKIIDRKYVEVKNEIYYPLELGKKIVEELDLKFDFMDYKYTADIEKKLDLIASGERTYFDTVNDFYNTFKSQLNSKYTNDNFTLCSCGGIMLKRTSKDGKEFKGCSNYPLCKNII